MEPEMFYNVLKNMVKEYRNVSLSRHDVCNIQYTGDFVVSKACAEFHKSLSIYKIHFIIFELKNT